LDGGGPHFEDGGSFSQFCGGLEFAVGVDDLGAALAFRFGLAGNGALHVLRDVHLLQLHLGDFDAPGLGVLIEDVLELFVHFVAFGKDGVELELAANAAQGGLGELRGGVHVILGAREGQIGVDHLEVADGVDLCRDVVLRDDVLRGHVERFDLHGNAIERVNRPNHDGEAPGLGSVQHDAEAQDHAVFPLLDHENGVPEPDQKDKKRYGKSIRLHISSSSRRAPGSKRRDRPRRANPLLQLRAKTGGINPPLQLRAAGGSLPPLSYGQEGAWTCVSFSSVAGATSKVRPSTRTTRTFEPVGICCCARACQSSPPTKTMPVPSTGSRISPICPTSCALPVEGFIVKVRKARRMTTTASTAKGMVNPRATAGLTPSPVMGERTRTSAPASMATTPRSASTPWLVTFASIAKSATA